MELNFVLETAIPAQTKARGEYAIKFVTWILTMIPILIPHLGPQNYHPSVYTRTQRLGLNASYKLDPSERTVSVAIIMEI